MWRRIAIWLPWQPLGTKSDASLPRRRAASASSVRTVGSSPNTSSPTTASAIALLMAGVGRVTVSLRKSAGSWGMGARFYFAGASTSTVTSSSSSKTPSGPAEATIAGAPGAGRE